MSTTTKNARLEWENQGLRTQLASLRVQLRAAHVTLEELCRHAREGLDWSYAEATGLADQIAAVLANGDGLHCAGCNGKLRVCREALEKHQRCYHGVPHCACTQPARMALAATKGDE